MTIYFGIQTICGTVLSLSSLRTNAISSFQVIILFLAVFLALSQNVYLEPIAVEHMQVYLQCKKKDATSAEFKRARGKFFKWHGISALMNVFVTMAITFHVHYLSTLLNFGWKTRTYLVWLQLFWYYVFSRLFCVRWLAQL